MKKWTVEMKQSYHTINIDFDDVDVALAFAKVILVASNDIDVSVKEVKAEEVSE